MSKTYYKHTCIKVNKFDCLTANVIANTFAVMNFAERLKKARQYANLTQPQLADKLKGVMTQQNISLLERDISKGTEYTVQLANACNVNPTWLAMGEGNMINEPVDDMPMFSRSVRQPVAEYKNTLIDLDGNEAYPAIRRVNLKLSAGITGYSVEYDVEDKNPIVMGRDWFEKRGYIPSKLLAIKVKGDSMIPGMNDSDTVVINTLDITPIDGVAFAINYEGELLVKRMIRDAGVWWLSSDNPDQRRHPRKQCEGDLCIILGKIVHKQSEVI